MSEKVSIAAFDYAGLDAPTRRQLEKNAASIRRNVAQGTRAFLEIGRQLLEVKALLPHGSFSRWVEANCQFGQHSAQNFMHAAAFARQHEELAELDQTAIILLAAPRLDEAVRGRAIEAVRGGVTTAKGIRRFLKNERMAARSPREDRLDHDPNLREFVSILLSGLSEADLGRVRMIVSGIEASFEDLATMLHSTEQRYGLHPVSKTPS